ncbi:MAG: SGNH/GDSL hydrolase family protein [Bacteroidota bacterium]
MKNKILVLGCFIVLLQFGACSPSMIKHEEEHTGIIDSDDPSIQYVGRFDYANPKSVAFDWPGVYICAKFEGAGCSIRLNDHKNEYAVIVDHRAPRLLTTDSSSIYTLASGLSNSVPHSIMIQKRTETFIGKGIFSGFILDKGCKLLPPDERPDRRIEFIGNSITCGFGVEGDSSGCHFSPETENACMSYASMTARALNADYSLIAYSGRGVVRNYGDSSKISRDPMPSLYDRICFSDSIKKWNYTQWVPQAVVINLGTNDFSTQPYPDSAIFQKAYTRLIHRVRTQYPGVEIFCLCGPMIGEPCLGYIKEVVEREQMGKRDKDVFFVGIDKTRLNDGDWGCDKHPNIFGMSKMTDILVSAMKLRMNW